MKEVEIIIRVQSYAFGINRIAWAEKFINAGGLERLKVTLKEGFIGQIDEVRIWKRALTQTEIRNNMSKKLAGTESGLVAYYKMDEGTGTIVEDSSPNSNNGTLKP